MSDPDASGTGPALDPATRRRVVRERYARIANRTGAGSADCCSEDEAGTGESDRDRTRESDGTGSGGCCGDRSDGGTVAAETAQRLGYSTADLEGGAGEANLGLGCGNPQAIASISAGETVLDLGSGAGFDCFLAARQTGETGTVIGVDMTPEMVERARANAAANDADGATVDFRLGEIERLPVADASVDVVISNCVVNLSPDKPRVFREAFRVLRPGGRIAIADVALTADVPSAVRADPDSVAGCVAGASTVDRLEGMLADAGFDRVTVTPTDDSEGLVRDWDDEFDVSEFVVPARITGRKPA